MKREMEPYQLIERSIIKKYRKELWTPFIVAVKRYELIKAGDTDQNAQYYDWRIKKEQCRQRDAADNNYQFAGRTQKAADSQ